MSNFKSIVIECSRENSVDVQTYGLTDSRSGNPATWTNLTNLQLDAGDQVSVQLSTIHAIGADNADTIELQGEADETTGLTDNQVLMEFTPYVCNTGRSNFVVCPYVFGYYPYLEYDPFHETAPGVYSRGLEYYRVIPQKTFRNPDAAHGGIATGKMGTALYGMPIAETLQAPQAGYIFKPENNLPAFTSSNNINPNNPWWHKSANLQEKVDGSRFVKVNRLYRGPFQKEDGTWYSNDTTARFFTEKYEVPIEISAPKYESPAVICNDINEIFHRTAPMSDNNFTATAKALENHDELMNLNRLAGPLFQYFAANGQVPEDPSYEHSDRFWGQICVKDENKWYMVHYGMRLDININSFAPPSTGVAEDVFYPCFWSGRYKAMWDTAGHPVDNIYRYPALRYDAYAGGKANPRQYRYYSTFPEFFMLATNIQWSQANIDILIKCFQKNERYEGEHSKYDDATKDVDNWYIDLDVGRTDECNNGVDDANALGRHPMDDPYYDEWNGGAFADKDKYNKLQEWVTWDEDTLDALKPLHPHYITMADSQLNNIDYCPSPAQSYKRNTHDANRVGGAMDRAGSVRVYSRFIEDWDNKVLFRNFPEALGNIPILYGDGLATDDASNPRGNEFWDGFAESAEDVRGYGIYPVHTYDLAGNRHNSIGFMVYSPTAWRDATTAKWYVEDAEARQNGYTGKTIRPSWVIPNLSYALASPSSMDNPYGLLVNPNVTNNFAKGFSDGNDTAGTPNIDFQGMPDTMEGFCNFTMLGANNPTCVFDTTLSRASFQNLHTERLLGGDELIYKKGSTTDVIGTNIGVASVVFNDTGFPGGWFNQLKYDNAKAGKPSESKVENDTNANGCFSDALTGVYISNVYFQKEGQLIQSSSDSRAVEATETNFYNTLLYKLGFRYEDLFPDFGTPNSRHNQGYQKDYSLANRYKSVKPITTNENLTISSAPALNLIDGVESFDATGAGEPSFKLGLGSFNHFNIEAPGSTQILASRLPKRLDTSFYLIYSDIVVSDYHQEEKTLSVVGISSKAYTSGDFFISFGDNSFGEITNTKPHYVKSITTQIRYPSGKLAAVSEKSSVVYKIVKPNYQPTPESIIDPPPDPQKQALYQLRKQNKNLEDLIDIQMELLNRKMDKSD